MFIFGWPGKRRRPKRMAARERPHGSARREQPQQHSHQARSTGADEVLLAAHAAGHAGRVPVRLRHVEHRIGAELRPLPPEGPGPGLPGLRGVARRGRRGDPSRSIGGPVRPQGAAGHRRRHLRGRLDPAAVTWHTSVLLIARTLIGVAIGADSAIATAYIAEYAPKDRRGALTMLQQWMITVGILVAYIVALIIFALWPASAASSGWRLVLGLGAVPALIGLVMRSRMPESPRWLLRHGKYDEVRKAM